MSIQYIGARYVPKLFESPNGGAAWIPNIAYEALTIVTYANNSYTSRIPVPASVGSPNENPHYWASTGVYSAYVETLRQEIQAVSQDLDQAEQDIETLNSQAGQIPTLSARIEAVNTSLTAKNLQQDNEIDSLNKKYYKFKDRKVLFVGDSYSEGWTPDGTNTGWSARVISLLGLSGAVIRHKSGIGFNHSIDNINFSNIVDDVPNKDTFTDIVVCGGRNDAPFTEGDIIGAVESTINHYKSLFPNALIHIGMIAFSTESTTVEITKMYIAYLNGTEHRGEHYLYGVETALSSGQYMASDGMHPNSNGQQKIAEAVATALVSGMFRQARNLPSLTRDTTNFNSGVMAAKMIGDNVRLIWTDFRGDASTPIVSGGFTYLDLGTHDFGLRFFGGFTYFSAIATLTYGSGTRVTIPVNIKIGKDKVTAEFVISKPDGSGWASGNITSYTIFHGSALLSIWD